MCKTKELVFHRPNARNYLTPSELPGIERVLCAKLLGVWPQNYFSIRNDVYDIMHICNQRSYLLTKLKRQGLPMAQLKSVFDAIVLSRVLYAAPAWKGYLSAGEMVNLQQLFAKAKRWNIVASNYDIDVLLDNCDRTLFRSSLYITHCLRHLLPDKRDDTHAMPLRPRGHNYSLPRFKFLHARNSFINRLLYKYVKSY